MFQTFLQLVEDLWKGRKKLKADRRMTGSSIIDEVLQEVRYGNHGEGRAGN